jgi:hypothetical protein
MSPQTDDSDSDQNEPLKFKDIKILSILGEGSFGKVFKVQLPNSD